MRGIEERERDVKALEEAIEKKQEEKENEKGRETKN